MDYNELETNVLGPDEQTIEIVIGVTSTHSFRLHCDSSFVSFDNNGVVNYDKNGVQLIRTTHKVYIDANETGKERIFFVQSTNKYNEAITSALLFKQLPKEKKEEQAGDNEDQNGEQAGGDENQNGEQTGGDEDQNGEQTGGDEDQNGDGV